MANNCERRPKLLHGYAAFVTLMICLFAACSSDANAREKGISSQIALVEFYEPDEFDTVQIGTHLLPSRGHEQTTSTWRVRLDLGLVDPQSDWIPFAANGLTNRLRSSQLYGFRVEHMISYRIGAEFSMFRAGKLSARADGAGFAGGELNEFSPYALGLNLHLTPDRPIDLYIGVQVANVDHGNLMITTQDSGMTVITPVSSKLGWGLLVGADVPLGRRGWLIHAGLRLLHFRFQYESTATQTRSFNAYVAAVGLGYRF